MPGIVVAGQIARDLVLVVDEVPGPGRSAVVRRRREMLGGKGANQAVALSQLGQPVTLVGVVGDDATGAWLLERARRDRIDVTPVIRRPGATSGLIADIVDASGQWRYLEDLPTAVLLTEADVTGAAGTFAAADWVSVQLQQPAEAVRAAARHARAVGCRVVFDGVPGGGADGDGLLAAADVVRADAREAGLLAGEPVAAAGEALRVAGDILRRGPSMVVLAAGGDGNVFAWRGGWGEGHVVLPLTGQPVADTTGAGDALTAALIAALSRGERPEDAARQAAAAAAATVQHPGGRPDLTADALKRQLSRLP